MNQNHALCSASRLKLLALMQRFLVEIPVENSSWLKEISIDLAQCSACCHVLNITINSARKVAAMRADNLCVADLYRDILAWNKARLLGLLQNPAARNKEVQFDEILNFPRYLQDSAVRNGFRCVYSAGVLASCAPTFLDSFRAKNHVSTGLAVLLFDQDILVRTWAHKLLESLSDLPFRQDSSTILEILEAFSLAVLEKPNVFQLCNDLASLESGFLALLAPLALDDLLASLKCCPTLPVAIVLLLKQSNSSTYTAGWCRFLEDLPALKAGDFIRDFVMAFSAHFSYSRIAESQSVSAHLLEIVEGFPQNSNFIPTLEAVLRGFIASSGTHENLCSLAVDYFSTLSQEQLQSSLTELVFGHIMMFPVREKLIRLVLEKDLDVLEQVSCGVMVQKSGAVKPCAVFYSRFGKEIKSWDASLFSALLMPLSRLKLMDDANDGENLEIKAFGAKLRVFILKSLAKIFASLEKTFDPKNSVAILDSILMGSSSLHIAFLNCCMVPEETMSRMFKRLVVKFQVDSEIAFMEALFYSATDLYFDTMLSFLSDISFSVPSANNDQFFVTLSKFILPNTSMICSNQDPDSIVPDRTQLAIRHALLTLLFNMQFYAMIDGHSEDLLSAVMASLVPLTKALDRIVIDTTEPFLYTLAVDQPYELLHFSVKNLTRWLISASAQMFFGFGKEMMAMLRSLLSFAKISNLHFREATKAEMGHLVESKKCAHDPALVVLFNHYVIPTTKDVKPAVGVASAAVQSKGKEKAKPSSTAHDIDLTDMTVLDRLLTDAPPPKRLKSAAVDTSDEDDQKSNFNMLLNDYDSRGITATKTSHKTTGIASSRSRFLDSPDQQLPRMVSRQPDLRVKNMDDVRQNINNATLDFVLTNILSWNFWDLEAHDRHIRPVQVVDSYADFKEYIKVFIPLFLLEIKAQILRSFTESIHEQQVIPLTVRSIGAIGNFYDVQFQCWPTSKMDEYNDSDLVVIALTSNPREDVRSVFSKQSPTCTYFIGRVCMFFSKNAQQYTLTTRISLQNRIQYLHEFKTDATCYSIKLASITTSIREYLALSGLPFFDLLKNILNPSTYPPIMIADQISSDLSLLMKYKTILKLNDSQARAVEAIVKTPSGFVLVQGPPGTGKTMMTLGAISALLFDFQSPSFLGGQASSTNLKIKDSSRHLLVCAPSNAAVDELARRMRRGVFDAHGLRVKLQIVRLGTLEGVHESVRDLTLEQLVENRLQADPEYSLLVQKDVSQGPISKYRNEIEEIKKEMAEKYVLLDEFENQKDESYLALEGKLDELGERKRTLWDSLSKALAKKDATKSALDRLRFRLRTQIINEADVILSTLSMSGHDTLLRELRYGFHTVLIDEACQAIELSTLIPLKYICKKCVLVGDPNQLPPTVLSQDAQSFGYDRDLFSRIVRGCPGAFYMLETQYRMHPAISRFPSSRFYENRLKDGPSTTADNVRIWHSHESQLFNPYLFLDIDEGNEQKSKKTESFYNEHEVNAALQLFEKLCISYPEIAFAGRVGIITPYKEQQHKLRAAFASKFGFNIRRCIDVNTVDGFQGQEKEIIIFSCVRASESSHIGVLADRKSSGRGGIGFLADMRRLNVGLTRAKTSLWILGNARSLERNGLWKDLIDDARAQNAFRQVRMPLYKRQQRDAVPKNAMSWPEVQRPVKSPIRLLRQAPQPTHDRQHQPTHYYPQQRHRQQQEQSDIIPRQLYQNDWRDNQQPDQDRNEDQQPAKPPKIKKPAAPGANEFDLDRLIQDIDTTAKTYSKRS